ncbi:MAG: DUF805 domain-containing protein [Burkholderiales bacterium]|nr:MAG: DUF805 domain-containing protein [Burkholderiales bacterium]
MKPNTLVSSEGRLSRNGYLQVFVAPLVGLAIATWAAFTLAPDLFLSGPAAMVFALGWVLFLSVADALNIRRWHDLGVSGSLYRLARPFVVILPIAAFGVQFLLPSLMASTGDYHALAFLIGQDLGGWSIQPVPLALLGITLVGVIGNVAYLAAMPGQKGPNDHGPDPQSGASVFATGDGAQNDESDPVKRALAEYQARQAKHAKPAATMVTQVRPAPAGGAFGKRRSS